MTAGLATVSSGVCCAQLHRDTRERVRYYEFDQRAKPEVECDGGIEVLVLSVGLEEGGDVFAKRRMVARAGWHRLERVRSGRGCHALDEDRPRALSHPPMPEPAASQCDPEKLDVTILERGLSELVGADRLHSAGLAIRLIEARDRLVGGWIEVSRADEGAVDLGLLWFWPGQPRIAELIDTLGLGAFAQFSKGDQLYEDQEGSIRQSVGFACMKGHSGLRGDAVTE